MHRKSGLVLALATLALVVVPSMALGFSVTTSPQNSKTIKRFLQNKVYYFLHKNCSADLEKKACLDTLRQGFAGWMEPSCGALKFVEGYHCNLASQTCLYDSKYGKAVSCKSDADCPAAANNQLMTLGYNPNKRSELNFAEGKEWTHGSFVLGVTIAMSPSWNGAIAEADITFNGKDHKWTTNPYAAGQGIQDLLSVAIHEQGHFFGVQHVLGDFDKNDLPTMAPNVWPQGISQTLSADDQKVICFLNPAGGKYTCKTDADCPYVVSHSYKTGQESYTAKMVCKSGGCVWGDLQQAPKAPIGGNCTSNEQCQTDLFCQSFGPQAYCAKYCNVDVKNCPSGFTCYGYKTSSNGLGACLPGQGGGQGKATGSACTSSNECASLMCLQGVCRTPCTSSDAGTKCNMAIEVCQPVPGTNGGVCMPKGTASGKKPLESECSGPEECDSNLCMKDDLMAQVGHCRQICTGPNTCPFNFKCVQQAEGYQGCLPGNETLPTGSPCVYTKDCDVGPCIPGKSGGTFCTAPCKLEDASSCPCGLQCETTAQGPRCFVGKPVKCLDIDAPCGDAGECASGICQGESCRRPCNVLGDPAQSGCAPDEGCVRLAPGSADGMCWPRGTGAAGAPCTDDKLCQGLFCASDVAAAGALRCMKPCAPGSTSCGQGNTCAGLSETIGACQGAGTQPTPDAVGGDVLAGFTPATGTQPPATSSGCAARPAGGPHGQAGGLLAAMLVLCGLLWRRQSA